jgi:hypothetical protein
MTAIMESRLQVLPLDDVSDDDLRRQPAIGLSDIQGRDWCILVWSDDSDPVPIPTMFDIDSRDPEAVRAAIARIWRAASA